MAVDALPGEVAHALATSPTVRFLVGGERCPRGASLAHAPLDDRVMLFVSPAHPVNEGLEETTRAEVLARAEDGSWEVRLEGRARLGRPVMASPRRLELLPWVPEGGDPRRLRAVPFLPERATFQQGERTWSGPTPWGRALERPGAVWMRALYGRALAVVAAGVAALWLRLALEGPDYPLRPLAMALGAAVVAAGVGAARLAFGVAAFRRWLEGRGDPEDCRPFVDAWMAPAPARRTAWLLGGIALAAWCTTWLWGPRLALFVAACTGLWALVPYWATLLARTPEDLRQA